jgi:hypothetical protein
VGEGAKRTRRFPCEEEVEAADMIELSMVRAAKRHRQAHGPRLIGIQAFESRGTLGYIVYLNPIELVASVVKPWDQVSPRRESRRIWPEVRRRPYE